MPSSRAACTTSREPSMSSFMPRLLVPSPTTDTTNPERPSLRNSMLVTVAPPPLTVAPGRFSERATFEPTDRALRALRRRQGHGRGGRPRVAPPRLGVGLLHHAPAPGG